jgi:hypothetical protein
MVNARLDPNIFVLTFREDWKQERPRTTRCSTAPSSRPIPLAPSSRSDRRAGSVPCFDAPSAAALGILLRQPGLPVLEEGAQGAFERRASRAPATVYYYQAVSPWGRRLGRFMSGPDREDRNRPSQGGPNRPTPGERVALRQARLRAGAALNIAIRQERSF